MLKNGSGIKEKNKGKFITSAKRAGEAAQEHATSILNNPKAITLQKKGTQFAEKFKHEDGSKIHKPVGHNLDMVVGNGWVAENRKEMKHRPSVSIHWTGGPVKRVNWNSLASDPEYKNNYNWKINSKNMGVIEDSLVNRGAGYAQRIGLLSQVVPESGGNTAPHGNGAYGLIGWRGVRASGLPKDLPGQTHKLMEGLFNPKAQHWNHGGAGTNVNSGREMQELYTNTDNSIQATKAVMKGFVRPEKTEWDKRIGFSKLLKKHMQ